MTVSLETRLPLIERDLAELRQALRAGGAERPIGTREVAARLGIAPATLAGWLKDPERRVRYHVDSYLSSRGRRWVSTPRAVERWKAHLASLGARSTKRSTVHVQAGR